MEHIFLCRELSVIKLKKKIKCICAYILWIDYTYNMVKEIFFKLRVIRGIFSVIFLHIKVS